MKKLCLVLVCGASLWLLPCSTASAIPLFYSQFEAKYAGNGAAPEFVALVKETKCNVCHIKGEKKSVRNSYGETLHKLGLEKENYKKERVDTEKDAVEKEITAAFEKAAAEKNGSGTYGDLFKTGKLPQ